MFSFPLFLRRGARNGAFIVSDFVRQINRLRIIVVGDWAIAHLLVLGINIVVGMIMLAWCSELGDVALARPNFIFVNSFGVWTFRNLSLFTLHRVVLIDVWVLWLVMHPLAFVLSTVLNLIRAHISGLRVNGILIILNFSLFTARRIFGLLVVISVAFFLLFVLLNVNFVTGDVNVIRLYSNLKPCLVTSFSNKFARHVVWLRNLQTLGGSKI